MFWLIGLTVVCLVLAASYALRVNAFRFAVRVGREVEAFGPLQPSAAPVEEVRFDRLPAPVRRYLTRAIARDRAPVASAHIKHGGTFRPKLDGAWLPIRGIEYLRAEPPAFIWWGRVRMAPGLWIDARDRFENGRGNMLVLMDSTFTLANSSGPQIDQGAMLRLLAEMVWIPTALLEPRVVWKGLGDRRAEVTLRICQESVTGTFEFGDDDLPVGFRAMRYRDIGHGQTLLTEFYGTMSDYREVNGLLVPHSLVAHWKVGDQLVPYAQFEVTEIEFDQPFTETATRLPVDLRRVNERDASSRTARSRTASPAECLQ